MINIALPHTQSLCLSLRIPPSLALANCLPGIVRWWKSSNPAPYKTHNELC